MVLLQTLVVQLHLVTKTYLQQVIFQVRTLQEQVSTHTLGTVEISGNSIRSTDSTQLEINDSAKIVGPLVAGVTTINPAGSSNITSSTVIYRI